MTVHDVDIATAKPGTLPFWFGDSLASGVNGLEIDGVPLADIAMKYGTPIYVYSATTIRRRLAELRQALQSTGAAFGIRYAMKANRFAGFLDVIRREGDIGIDACSPREVKSALESGFAASEISVTASMLSNRDLQAFGNYGVRVNLDSMSALRRWAAVLTEKRCVGLRIDPAIGVGWGERPKLAYGNSKFGFEFDSVIDVVAYAASLGLEVNELHMHAGWGLQISAAPLLEEVFARIAALAKAIPTVKTINVGGGLAPRHREQDQPLPLSTWADLLRKHIAPTGCAIACEPGTFIAATAGVLIAEVNTREVRRSGTWIGVDAGHSINCYMAHYEIPHAIIAIARPLDPPAEPIHLAGNINEANDVFARAIAMPRLEERDLIAFYPAGAYGSSMASDHCLRGLPTEVMV
jgi:diaminopimelate decarboxylase